MAYDRNAAVEVRAEMLESVAPRARVKRVALTLIARWFAQLAVMLRAGIPLTQVLASLRETEAHGRWRAVQSALLADLRSGAGFSEAMRKYPALFDALTVQLVATGEQTGQLDTVLAEIARALEQRVALRAKLRQALVYPVCVLLVAVGIAIFMLLFVVPQFATLFAANNAALPWLTVQLVRASDFVRAHPVSLSVGGLACGVLMWVTRAGWLTHLASRVPIARDVWLNAAIARWSATLALTLRAGLPFLEGLKLACANAQHPVFTRHAAKWSFAIEDGASLREALGKAGVFLPWSLQMLAMGQESGQLDTMLDRIAEFHLERVNRTMATLSTLLEPVVMIVIGVLVGTMLLAMYLPIFELSNAIG